jgi:ABC-type nitrate/sulfonate/bicarbonate transport system ATPase subunit
MLDFHEVTLSYGRRAVIQNMSLHTSQASRLIVVCGPSGTGKSTLLRALAGLHAPTHGTISALGGATLSYLPQGLALFPWKSVIENAEFGLLCKGVKQDARRSKAKALLDQLGLEQYADAAIHELSGGMKQRVALARALATSPDLVLLDEPFSSLDHAMTFELCALIKRFAVTTSRFVVVTHDVQACAILADEVVIIKPSHVSVLAGCLAGQSSACTEEVARFAQSLADTLTEETVRT